MSRIALLTLVTLTTVAVAACGTGERETAETAQRTSLSDPPPVEQELPPTPLEAEVASRDLGTVGIADGLVETAFSVTNSADEPTELAAAYTSCMCTEVTLEFQDGSVAGPFGMPGHELPVTLTRTLAPGETFTARATFDPMAHGPDAVGPVQRAIALHSGNGGMLQLDFFVNVVKEVSE
ncbi:MAG: hypothetical protein ACN0LA_09710 [Candidatus Longimicrobiales bacterium M2_2A_002]